MLLQFNPDSWLVDQHFSFNRCLNQQFSSQGFYSILDKAIMQLTIQYLIIKIKTDIIIILSAGTDLFFFIFVLFFFAVPLLTPVAFHGKK